MRISNARVSTQDQHPELQLYMLVGASCEQVFQEKMSGKDRGWCRCRITAGIDSLRCSLNTTALYERAIAKVVIRLNVVVFALYLSRAKD